MARKTKSWANALFTLAALTAGLTFYAVRPASVAADERGKVWCGSDCCGVCYNGPMVCCAPDE